MDKSYHRVVDAAALADADDEAVDQICEIPTSFNRHRRRRVRFFRTYIYLPSVSSLLDKRLMLCCVARARARTHNR